MTSTLTPALRAWRILVVDDDALVALTLQDGLAKLPGCEVAAATSGEEALRLIEQEHFDLLITDYRMPGMDGITLVKRARQVHPQMLSVMLTAYCNSEVRDQAMAASINRILDKPIELTELRSVIEVLARNDPCGTDAPGAAGDYAAPSAPAGKR